MVTELHSIVNCPQCAKRIRVPTDKGRIRFSCPQCQTRLIWFEQQVMPEPTAQPQQVSEPQATNDSDVNISKRAPAKSAWLQRLVLVFVVIALLSLFNRQLGQSSVGALLGFVLLGLIIWQLYLAIRQLCAGRTVLSVVLTFFSLQLLAWLAVGIKSLDERYSLVQSLSSPAGPAGHFSQASAKDTSPAQLDELMESWQ